MSTTNTVTSSTTSSLLGALAVLIIIPIIVGLGVWWFLGQGRKAIDSAPGSAVTCERVNIVSALPVQAVQSDQLWQERNPIV